MKEIINFIYLKNFVLTNENLQVKNQTIDGRLEYINHFVEYNGYSIHYMQNNPKYRKDPFIFIKNNDNKIFQTIWSNSRNKEVPSGGWTIKENQADLQMVVNLMEKDTLRMTLKRDLPAKNDTQAKLRKI